jgi:OOP family OmpA-OmpF porin
MIQPSKWWIGLLPLAVLFALAMNLNGEKIEADIASRARSALSREPQALAEAAIAVEGRDVTISGVALSRDGVERIVATIARQEGVRTVLDKTAAPVEAKPFVLSLERKGKALTLRGHAPPGAAREALRAAAASKGYDVIDSAGYALGAPEDFGALANYALALLDALGDGKATLSDARLAVTGAPATFEAYDRALAALKSPPAGASVETADIAPPKVAPFVWSAVKGGETVSLFGYAPSPEVRGTLVREAATLTKTPKVSDQSRVAGGAPANFAGAATAALGALAGLEQGKATLTDASLSIEGAGKANVASASVEAGLRAALPKGFRLGEVKIAAGVVSPYVLTARKEESALALSGHAPDPATHQRLVALVGKAFGGKIEDGLATGAGAPAGFERAAAAALRALTRLNNGAAAISDRRVAIEGDAFVPPAADDIPARLAKDTPEGFETSARIGVAPRGEEIAWGELHAKVAATVAPGLSFSGDHSALAEESLPVADALAFVLLRSPGAAVEIVGHYEGAGSASENQAIARRRAEVLRDYLVAAGVDARRLTASGVGEAPGEGAAPRRRIEFLVK